MNRTICLLLTALVGACILAGCQRTPESPIVVGKNLDRVIEKAKQEPTKEEQDAVAPLDRYQDAFSDGTGRLKVTIDADVIHPETSVFPVIRVSRGTIDNVELKAILKELLHGSLYSCEYAYSSRRSKQEVLEEILRIEKESTSLYRNGIIQYLKEEMEAAPDVRPQVPFDYDGERSESKVLYGYSIGNNDRYETVSAYSNVVRYVSSTEMTLSPGAYTSLAEAAFKQNHPELMNSHDLSLGQIEQIPDLIITEQEALSLADAALENIGLTGFACNHIEKKYGGNLKYDGVYPDFVSQQAAWILNYATAVDGTATTYTSEDCCISEDDYSVPWTYERLVFHITDDGIVMFEWAAPIEQTETVVESATLLPFEDVMSIFERLLLAKNLWFDGDSAEISITEIRLGYGRITEQNKRDSGLLIPVWDFFGTMTSNGEQLSIMEQTFNRSFLTINAIDGSIIDRSLGY